MMKIKQLINMVSLKFILKDDDGLEDLFSIVNWLNADIGMLFSFVKSSKVIFRKDTQVKSKNSTLDINKELTELENNIIYKYFRINEAKDIRHTINKEKKKRIRLENNSQSKNKI